MRPLVPLPIDRDRVWYRVDLIVADAVVAELKTVEPLVPVHDAQLLTYLRLGGWKVGLLINFDVARYQWTIAP